MPLVGYVNRWSVQQKGELIFHVSSSRDYDVSIVRLFHGDTNPAGPGFKSQPVAEIGHGFPAVVQDIHLGSYVRLDPDEAFPSDALTLSFWIQPTLFGPGPQGLVTRAPNDTEGWALFLSPGGHIVWRVGNDELVSAPVPLGRWTNVSASFDGDVMRMWVQPLEFDPLGSWPQLCEAPCGSPGVTAAPLLAGALAEAQLYRPEGCFNGKLSGLHVYNSALDLALLGGPAARPGAVLEWHFGLEVGSRRAVDRGPRKRHGEVVNRPARCVTGPHWRRQTDRYADAPDEYDAIWFHADDLEDCRWSPSFTFTIPADLPSGVYAAELRDGNETRHLPFFVTPPVGKARASMAVLIPTLSYLAYSNESLPPNILAPITPRRGPALQADDYSYISANRILSLYDYHLDGSGRCMTTTLRPNLTSMNPSHRIRLFDGPHQLSADLHLIDWLQEKSFDCDVITDHELHLHGANLLEPYRVVITGTHAEYWTSGMLDGLERYKQDGGRVVYLSGNGLYWVTALDDSGTVAEIRRRGGTETWSAAGGEVTISLSGEAGGLWKDRGRAPQRYVGVGMAAQGADRGAPYRRTPQSYDERAAFIFAGIDNELLGDFPALVLGHGAAGYEIDRADVGLGTPRHALVLASSTGFSDCYQYVREQTGLTTPFDGGTLNPEVRADIVYFEGPNAGAVLSVGSIAFCSTLSYNNYENNISILLNNVLTTFNDPAWTP
ncbi:MAG: hypothetical protein JWR80_2232 [Bradyrhizobium sp.]|nr:hypothetical protein [Bradyrhizobium sp.]